MRNRILKILIPLSVVLFTVIQGGGLNIFNKDLTVRAFGDLTVDFHVLPGTPIFSINNMAPGDSSSKNVDVTNDGITPHIVALKGIRVEGVGTPQIENILGIVITDGAIPLYGTGSPTGGKTVQNFFIDSASVNGIILGAISPSGHKTYTLTVSFPTSAGDEYQAKSVLFDLSFGTSDIESIVINEVYYKVDKNHRDRNSDEKDNDDKDNKGRKGERNDNDDREEKNGKNYEWVELYNPTDKDISLKNWSLTDNSGKPTIIHPDKKIKAGGFALISKDASIWKFWNGSKNILKIELGGQIGNGLDDKGDHLILKDNKGKEIDRMSWGTDTSGFTPPAPNPVVPLGSSTERVGPGFDTNKASDWMPRNPPTPGH